MDFMRNDEASDIFMEGIRCRDKLCVVYEHKGDYEVVEHVIAPFDIGTTNPRTRFWYSNTLFAFTYDHFDRSGNLDQKVLAFDLSHFIHIWRIGEHFDPIELSNIHYNRTGFDYSRWEFAVEKDRDWFGIANNVWKEIRISFN